MALVTFEAVARACEALVAEGRAASTRNVRDFLGGGSPNSISPLLKEWKAGRVTVRTKDFEISSSITQAIASEMERVSAIAAKAAEDRAAEVQDDSDLIAEVGLELEAKVQVLEAALAEAQQQIALKVRALEDFQAATQIDEKNREEKISYLTNLCDSERERADKAVQSVAKAEVRLELIPALQADVERLKPFEKQVATLEAHVVAANAKISDLQYLADSNRADAKELQSELTAARSSEGSLKAKLEGALREVESVTSTLAECKAERAEALADARLARTEAATAVAEAKELKAALSEYKSALASLPTKAPQQ